MGMQKNNSNEHSLNHLKVSNGTAFHQPMISAILKGEADGHILPTLPANEPKFTAFKGQVFSND